MRLNDTCIPNTDPNTGEICLYISGQPAEKRPRRSLKKSVESEPYEDSNDKVSLVTSTDVTSTDGDLDCYWDYLEQLAVSRVAQSQTVDTDFADVVIQPDPNE